MVQTVRVADLVGLLAYIFHVYTDIPSYLV